MAAPASAVVMYTRYGSTAKCTSARARTGSWTASRSDRYWLIAWSTVCPVSGFFSSAVATSSPLTNRATSIVFVCLDE